ncbi:hypothetical protein AVEN_223646-1 [Araneus ventricosus]|uniref:Uncharacterized protein n=1 Tax=Araneus ventricosus TaxID=182803 RepID=A0A4Y2JSV7_ARAVE|nr:hypothetical protein AVEN_223646-1 [Araneus ventricosus]
MFGNVNVRYRHKPNSSFNLLKVADPQTPSPSREREPIAYLELGASTPSHHTVSFRQQLWCEQRPLWSSAKAPPMSNLHPTDPLSDPVPPLSHRLPSRLFLRLRGLSLAFSCVNHLREDFSNFLVKAPEMEVCVGVVCYC